MIKPIEAIRSSIVVTRNLDHARRSLLSAVLGIGLIFALILIPGGQATAQLGAMVNPDGAFPVAGLTMSAGTLYGTAQAGGSWGHGAVFAVNIDGSGFVNLHSFTGSADGMNPYGALISSNSTLYGTANCGGNTGAGTVFKLNAAGTNFVTLYNFTALGGSSHMNNDGAEPYAGVAQSGDILFGTAEEGGSAGAGVVFAVNTDGTGFTNLHTFPAAISDGVTLTNSDGFGPQAGLVVSGSSLYGTAVAGGSAGSGTVFVLNTEGTRFTNLHNFAASNTNSLGVYTNNDGSGPVARLVLSSNTLYGTAPNGGSSGNGTVFAVNADGTGFRILHAFSELQNHSNIDGAMPHAGLVLSGNTLYGAAEYGGSSGNGTIFALNTDGTGFTNLYYFSFLYSPGTNSDGTYPYGTLLLSGNTLYGAALFGGDSDSGTVFSLKTDGTGFTTLHSFARLAMPLPQLTITFSGPDLVVTWPADTGLLRYSLESTTDMGAQLWSSVSFTANLVDGMNRVVLAPSPQTLFFRLKPLVGGCTSTIDCPSGSTCVGGACMSIIGGGGPGFGPGFGFGGFGFGFGGGGICSCHGGA
jgi:uncharacterized repeat protein (TIGR03803 family)